MHEAQMAIASSRPDENVRLLEQAAAVDPLDPNPLASAGYMCSKLASQNPDRDLSYMRQAVRLFEAAVQRDPRGHLLWRSLAAGSMRLARKLADPGAFQGAIEAKRQELLLYPTNPLAWLELSRMTVVRLSGQPEQPVLLRLALASLNRAETLSEARPGDDPTRFTAGQLAEIHRMQEDLTARLASLAGPPSTQSAR
jgi:tetratricopeptide (TPR) repeat protein